jgi:hypothetical protein
MKDAQAEILRKKYKYRELILKGKIKLSIEVAKKLIGPDTAYHLYSKLNDADDENRTDKDKKKEDGEKS